MIFLQKIASEIRKTILFCVVLIAPFHLFSQETEELKNQIIEQRVEYLIENDESNETDYTNIFEQLNTYYEKPLNLNSASATELNELSLLNDIQINNLLSHIKTNGKLMTLEELQTIQGFDLATIRMISPFVRVSFDVNNPQLSLKELINNGNNSVFFRMEQVLEEKKGYSETTDSAMLASPNSRYLGDKNKYYTRYNYTYGNHISFGITAEKDAGEEFFKGSQTKGFDYYSAHFFLRNQGKIKQLALGDYQAQFGQGLTFWSGMAFGKSADIMLVKRSAVGLKPYKSADENLFLRGAGIALNFDEIEVTSFFSSNRIDGNIDVADSTSTTEDEFSITSIQNTGFHRTKNEIEDKDAIIKNTMGGHISYKTRTLNVGVTGVYDEIDAVFKPSLDVYNQFRNSSSQQTNLGVDYNWVYKNYNFFGEFSKSINGGTAWVSGALINLTGNLSLSVLYRDYARNFHPIYSVGIGENTTNENERGIYIGFSALLSSKFTLSAYFDQYVFPWLKYQTNAPSSGFQYLAQLTYKPSKKIEMYVRVRDRNSMKNTPIDLEDGIDFISPQSQTNYRYNLSYSISPSLKLKNRVELTNVDITGAPFETGFLIYQDVVYQKLNSPIQISFRYGIFQTDSYTSRIYAYENDVLYAYSIPAYYNKGTRTYLTLRYKFNKGIDLWLRYGITYYENADVISSGLEKINGNTKSDVKIQLRYKF